MNYKPLLVLILITSMFSASCASQINTSRKIRSSDKNYTTINNVLSRKKGGKIILKEPYSFDSSIVKEIFVDEFHVINNDSLFYKVTADGKLIGKPLSAISKIGVDRKFGFNSASAAYLTALASGLAITLTADKNFRNNYDYDVLGSLRVPVFTFLGIGLTVLTLGAANLINGSPTPNNYIFYTIE